MPSLGLTEQAHADEEKTIKVFMTISDKGAVAKTKDNDLMAWKEVTVKDLDEDGKYTFDEALKAAHEQYNSAEGYAATSSGWVTSLWGDAVAGVYSFIKNCKATDVVTVEEVADGDYLEAAVDQDAVYYSDYATFFDAYTKTVRTGEEFELTLKGFGAMTTDEGAPLAGIKVGAVENGAVAGDTVTDENGKAKIKFDKAGTYVVSAEGVVKGAESSVYATPAGLGEDGKHYYCSRTDYSTYDSFILYTEADHGYGPYPVDEIKEIDFYDWNELDEDEQAAYHLVYASNYVNEYEAYYSVILDAPIIVPCCVITVVEMPEEIKENIRTAVRNFEKPNKFDSLPQDIEVSSNAAEDFGEYRDITIAGNGGKVTFADVIYTLHKMKYGDAFTKETAADYIGLSDSGYFSKCFGIKTANISYLVNEDLTMSGGAFTLALSDGDRVDLYKYLDEVGFGDLYSHFKEEEKKVKVGQEFALQLEGLGWSFPLGPLQKSANKDLVAATYDENGEITPIDGVIMDEKGQITLKFAKAGTYYVTASGYVNAPVADYSQYPDITYTDADVPVVLPYCKVTVEKLANTMTAKAKTLKVKFAKTKKKSQAFKAAKGFTVKKAQGKLTYKVTKKDKKAKNKIVIAKNGKITVKKGIKKGTYKIKVKITAAGNAAYKPLSKPVTLKVSVK